MTRLDRALEGFAKSKAGGWWFINVAPHLDRPLMALSRGRVSTALGQPICIVFTRGARSGKERRTPLLYAEDGENLVLTASKAGARSHPAWYHNLKANPDVEVLRKGRREPRRAREAAGAERERLWELVNDLYAGYDVYQSRAGERTIPVMVLQPR